MCPKWIKVIFALGFILILICLPACSLFGEIERIDGIEITEVSIPYLENAGEARISIHIAEAQLEANGDGTKLIDGTIKYNLSSMRPKIIIKDSDIAIRQTKSMREDPKTEIVNEWDIHFGKDAPFILDILGSNYSGNWELGGLPIRELEIVQGLCVSTFNFSEPNPVVMKHMEVQVGTSEIKLFNLANANLEEFHFGGGASSYLIDFSGDIKRDTEISITMNFGNVIMVIPPDIAAEIRWEGSVGSIINTDSDISKQSSDKRQGDLYVNEAWFNNDGPKLNIKLRFTRGDINIISKLPEET